MAVPWKVRGFNMIHRPKINCKHLDNFDRCRIKKEPWYTRWLAPKGRLYCIEMKRRDTIIQDNDDIPPCEDIEPR